jgi:thioredoxin 1
MKNGIQTLAFIILIHTQSCAQNTNSGVALVGTTDFKYAIDSLPDEQLVDVRTPEEFEGGHISKAKNIDFYAADFSAQLSKLSKVKPVLVYCKSGGRSAKAVNQLTQLGFTNITELKGGMMAWSGDHLPEEQGKLNVSQADTFTVSDYEKLVAENPALMIDFYAKWCVPCRKMEPFLQELTQEFKGQVKIQRIDVDQAKTLVEKLGIRELPVVAVYKNGQEVKRVNRFVDKKELTEMINLIK